MENKTAIIIGAGPAGLTAAYKFLTETDIKPVIFEESDFIGGISRTVVHNGNRMDIGGHRFFSKDDTVMDFWKELMPLQGNPAFDDKLLGREKPLAPNGPDPETEDRVSLVRTRVSRIYFLKKFFDYPISLSGATLKNMGFVNTMKAGFGYVKAMVFKKKETNLKNFYINRFGKPLYEMFFEDYTRKVWGVDPEYISADWGAQRVKGLSLSKAIFAILKKPFIKKNDINQKNVETSLIEQFIYPKKGPGQLWETLADEVEKLGGVIHKNNKVNEIVIENNKISKIITTDGEYTADYFVSSMPIKDLVESMGSAVPKNIQDIALNLPYRDFITVGLLVNKLNIKNNTKTKTLSDIVPDCWIYVQDREVKLGRLQIFNNWSPYMLEDPINTVWIGLEYFCTEGDDMWTATDENFIEFAAAELEKIGVINKSDVLDSVRVKVKKAYPSYFGTYEQFPQVIEYLNTIDNLYCVGRNGQHRYNNMDHSMLSAIEAVNIIKTGKTDKNPIWNVNAEKEYHEKK
ncbi:NAD(P)/FAD-dependent oxidoreductase [Eubacteriales bacterium OttesenSCG-928-G02]|nr:NAD(P)/FAD-dependent oxidoreductase [Eubacteriales bacterium OttesenSCG-928-G02]